MPQTMLLTRRLSTFLSSNVTSQLHTLLLITPAGKLLSSSSCSPGSTLRMQATLASSLWDLYNPFAPSTSSLVSAAIGTSDVAPGPNLTTSKDLNSIMLQLELGLMFVRALHCGLLFVAIGPYSIETQAPPSTSQSQTFSHSQSQPTSQMNSPPLPSHVSPRPSSPLPPHDESQRTTAVTAEARLLDERGSGPVNNVNVDMMVPPTAPLSDVGSTTTSSVGPPPNIMVVKKHAEDLGKWLDTNLEGLVLGTSEE